MDEENVVKVTIKLDSSDVPKGTKKASDALNDFGVNVHRTGAGTRGSFNPLVEELKRVHSTAQTVRQSFGELFSAHFFAELAENAMQAVAQKVLQLAQFVIDQLKESVKVASELQYEVNKSLSIKPDLDTSKVFKALSDMQRRVPQTSKQLAESLYDIFSSIEVSTDQALVLLEKFAKGATAAVTNTQTFGTAIMGVMNAYKLTIEDVDHVQDVFFNTVKNGVVTGEQLATNLGIATQAAKNAGVDFNTLGALIAGVTKEGGNAAQNINNLANTLQKLPTKDSLEAFKKLGVQVTDTTGKFRPIIQVLEETKTKLDQMSEGKRARVLQDIFPDAQARTGFQTLLSQLDNVKKFLDDNTTSVGAFQTAYDAMAQSYVVQSQLQENATRGLLEAIGDLIITNPALAESTAIVTEQITHTTDALRDQQIETNKSAAEFINFYAKVKANTIPFSAFMINMVKVIADALGLVLGGFVYDITKAFEFTANMVNKLGNKIVNTIIDAFNKVKEITGSLGEVIINAVAGPQAGAFFNSGPIPNIPLHQFDWSSGMSKNLSETEADMKASWAAMRELSMEGQEINRRINKATEENADKQNAALAQAAARRKQLEDQQNDLVARQNAIIQRRTTSVNDPFLGSVANGSTNTATDNSGTSGGRGRSGKRVSEEEREALSVLAGIARKGMVYPMSNNASLNQTILDYSNQYRIPSWLAFAQINAESSFKPNASSGVAYGLTQAKPSTASTVLGRNVTKNELLTNVDTAMTVWGKYMTSLYERYGNWELAVLAYHNGEGTVDDLVKLLQAGNQTAAAAMLRHMPKGTKYLRNIMQFQQGQETRNEMDSADMSAFKQQMEVMQNFGFEQQFDGNGKFAGWTRTNAEIGFVNNADSVSGTPAMRQTPDQDFAKQRTDNVNKSIDETIERQRTFASELGDIWKSVWTERQNKEMDTIGELARAEERLKYARADAANDYMANTRRTLMVRNDEIDLLERLQKAQDEYATSGENSALRIQAAYAEGWAEIARRSKTALEDIGRYQAELEDSTTFHADQMRAGVMRHAAESKNVTEIWTDAYTGMMDKLGSGVDSLLGRFTKHLGAIGDTIKDIVGNLIKMVTNKVMMKFLDAILGGGSGSAAGGGPAGVGGASGGGFNPLSLLTGVLGGGRGGLSFGMPATTAGFNGGFPALNFAGGGGGVGLTGSGPNQFAGSALGFGNSITGQSVQQAALENAIQSAGGSTQAAGAAGSAAVGSLFSSSGFGASLAPMLPFLGLSLGAGLGGPSTVGTILGGAGGLLLGGAGAVGLLGGAGAGIFAAGGSLASLGGAAALLTNPFTIAAGAALLVGAYFLGKKKQRQRDETSRDELKNQSFELMDTILKDVRHGRITGEQGVSAATKVMTDYYAQVATFKTASVRRSAENFRPFFMQRIDAIRQAGVVYTDKKSAADRLKQEFATGGVVSGPVGSRQDIVAHGGEIIANRSQQTPEVMTALVNAGVPNVTRPQSGGNGSGNFAQEINVQIVMGRQDQTQVLINGLESDRAQRALTDTLNELQLNREIG